MDFFKKESLVYLTADSPNTITSLSRDKVQFVEVLMLTEFLTVFCVV